MTSSPPPFRMVGLTGGIACGKSSVARHLKEAGLRVLDADLISREVVQPGTEGLQALTNAFGESILQEDGSLDRAKLGAVVFSDPEQRRKLNAILHPRIGQRTAKYVQQAREEGLRLVVYEAALLVENGLHHGFDLLLVVSATQEVQKTRLMARDGFSSQEVQQRLDAQLPLEDKRKAADMVIDNSGSPEELYQHVQEVLQELGARLWPDLDPAQRTLALGISQEAQ